ncbi:alcohol dehydrogenase [Brevundimonas vesicularis]|uniref:alcohol dehydrogenase n=1 Tax=Brevundimonas vesicularis TaxID=41276 RepID=A0A1Z3U6J2_BREVE|nr:alcohol dehydrogenase [Brevundimonas vesicularis]ASE38907.1 alcohol dehydrogenase [Brevundimonas vesicularis]
MKAWAVVAASAPLEKIELPTPEPRGREVLVEVTHCGLCHSDLHFWHGEYNMGGGRKMKLSERGVTLPRAPGHEILGTVTAVGEAVTEVKPGDVRVIYPWIGCGHCAACKAEQDNLCTGGPQSLGVMTNGGFGSHVLVREPKYLVDPGKVDLALASTYGCSGITAYGAVKKVMPLDPDQPVVLMGAGGLGLTAIAMLKAVGHRNIISVDMSPEKLQAAAVEGATQTLLGGEGAAERILEAAAGPVPAMIDFVNIDATAAVAMTILAKGGKLILVGVSGGELTLSLAGMVFRALTVQGTLMGSPQDLRDVIAMANDGRLAPTPVTCRHKHDVMEAMEELERGEVTGRLVLTGAV